MKQHPLSGGARVVAGADEGALAAQGWRLLLLRGRRLLLLLLLLRLLGQWTGLIRLARAGGPATVGPRSGGTATIGALLRRPVLALRAGACPLPCRSAALQSFSCGQATLVSQVLAPITARVRPSLHLPCCNAILYSIGKKSGIS